MEPVIRNFEDVYANANNYTGEGPPARLIWLEHQPPTCTMIYWELYPNRTSIRHMDPWEHEVYIMNGSGTLVCDGKEYPVKTGDAMFIPPNVDHHFLNNGGQGFIRSIEVNPLIAAQSAGTRSTGGKGTGQPPVIRNFQALNRQTGSRILSTRDGVPNYVMLYNGEMAPGAASHPETAGHSHAWEHMVYVLEGRATLVCDGKSYKISAGDAVLVPPNAPHQWRNDTRRPMKRITFNPKAAEAHGG